MWTRRSPDTRTSSPTLKPEAEARFTVRFPPDSMSIVTSYTVLVLRRFSTSFPATAPPTAPAAVAAGRPTSDSIQLGLRDALAAYLEETAEAVRAGVDSAAMRARAAKIGRLVEVCEEFQ